MEGTASTSTTSNTGTETPARPATASNNSQVEQQLLQLSGISVQSRLLPFWREHPQLWFVQFEAVVDPLHCSDDQKFRYVLQQLQSTDIAHLSDLLLRTPETGKYKALKERLLSVYGSSQVKNFQKLSGLELGDQKPSTLLRKMRELGGNMITDEGLRIEWLNHLPPSIRSTLAINSEAKLDTLAAMADKMFEYEGGHASVAAVSKTNISPSTPSSTSTTTEVGALAKIFEKLTFEISELRTEVAELKRSRHPARTRYRSSSHSRTRSASRKPGDKDWECRYHYKFGDKAKRCESPCARRKKSEN